MIRYANKVQPKILSNRIKIMMKKSLTWTYHNYRSYLQEAIQLMKSKAALNKRNY